MSKTVPIVATVAQPQYPMQVSAGAGGEGVSLGLTNKTTSVRLENRSAMMAMEFRYAGIGWAALAESQSTDLPVDLSTTPVYVRRAGRIIGSAPLLVTLDLPLGVLVDGSTGTSIQVGSPSGALNFKASNTNKLRKVIGAGISGLSRGRLLMIGTSVIRGVGAQGATWAGGVAGSMPSQLRKILLGAKADYLVADGGSGASLPTLISLDPRLSSAGSVGLLDGFYTLGGVMLDLAQNGSVTFTPGGTFARVEVMAAFSSGNGTYTVSVDGGTTALATVSTDSATQLVGKSKTNVTPGSTAVTIKCTSSAHVFIGLVGTYSSTARGLEIINAGFGGSRIARYTPADAWSPRVAVPVLLDADAPNAIAFECVINDAVAGSANFAADTTTALTALKNSGDVVYLVPPPVSNSAVSREIFDTYCDAGIAAALMLDLPVVDCRAIQPVWDNSIYFDDLHPLGILYGMWARQVASALNG